MARVELTLPDKFIFETQLTVRASDLNYGNHVGNDRILTLMQEARVLFYQSLGFKNEMSFEGSVGHVIADAVVVYKSETFLADVLRIEIAITDLTKYGFEIYYRITNQNNKEVALGKTGVVCFDFEKRKVAPVPGKLLEELNT